MRHCYVLRVFTRVSDDGRHVGGNHLGVITDVTGLADRVMQEIATELGFSETVYVDWRAPGNPAARIFTPEAELPFAGHPLVGAGWLLQVIGPGGPTAITCGVGDVAIEMTGDQSWIHPPAGQPVSTTDFDTTGVDRVEERVIVEMPLEYQMVRVASPEAVASVTVPTDPVKRLVWAWEVPGESVKARFFAPGVGVPEDPATGSAAVALSRVLVHGGVPAGSIEIHQGDEIGAPSTIRLRWDGDAIAVGGTVVRDEVRTIER